MKRTARFALLASLLIAGFSGFAFSQTLQSPEAFLGHRVGEDYTLARWEKIVDYFRLADEASGRVAVFDMGTTTEDRPFIYAAISSEDTIGDIDRHIATQKKLADPRLISGSEEEQRLVEEAKVVVFVNCCLHSNEIASSQMAIELLYDLATKNDAETREILDRVIVLLVPSANPDGMEKIIDWYERSLGKPWEGAGMPWLYQTYAGHDNNRDWFMLNLKETQLETRVLYKEWFPHIVYDIHQMGNRRARFFVPPFYDPKNPNIHPLTDDMLLIIGGHMASGLTRAGKRGVLHAAMYDNWWQGGFRTTVYRHNMVGLLTEAASVNIASPVFQRKSELRGGARGMPDYAMRANFPDPWPGGWWRLRDIVEYEKVASMSLFTLAARYHDLFQSNYIRLGRDAIARGKNEPPYAWIVPPDQHDSRASIEMLGKLHATGIEIHRAEETFSADGIEYPAGTFIMYCAQPYRAHLMDMLERQQYPHRTQYPGGPPESPYDTSGWTLPLQMGVRTVQADHRFEVKTTRLDAVPATPERSASIDGNLVMPGSGDDYRLINRLHRAGIPVGVVSDPNAIKNSDGDPAPAGSIVIRGGNKTKLRAATEGLILDYSGMKGKRSAVTPAAKPRTALYQPWTASMDEGWTRFVLDSFEFDYVSLHNAEIRAGNLIDRYDCIVLPSLGVGTILDGRAPDTTEPAYTGGIGTDGVVALQNFVRNGGTLVCIDHSSMLPISHFNIPVRNVLDGVPSDEFFCAGSILRVSLDNTHPVGYGMPDWISAYFARSMAFEISEPDENGNGNKSLNNGDRDPANRYPARVVARYSDTVLLESGAIVGEDLIKDKPAIVEVKYGDGNIVLLGFSVQHRGHTHGTFRLLFNAIQRSTMKE